MLTRPVLMMVTDRQWPAERAAGVPDGESAWGGLPAQAAAAARAGVDLVQVRERGLEDRALVALAVALRDAMSGAGARMIVNDRIDVALAAGANGVHLPASALPCARARAIVPDGFLVGRSVHSAAEAVTAERSGGCDYLIFGTVFESASKPAGHRVAGVRALAEVCAAVRLPVLAIGGITTARIPDVVRAGAALAVHLARLLSTLAGIAAVGLFAAGGEPELRDTVGEIRAAFASH